MYFFWNKISSRSMTRLKILHHFGITVNRPTRYNYHHSVTQWCNVYSLQDFRGSPISKGLRTSTNVKFMRFRFNFTGFVHFHWYKLRFNMTLQLAHYFPHPASLALSCRHIVPLLSIVFHAFTLQTTLGILIRLTFR